MMVEFEDREPIPPMGWPKRVGLAVLVLPLVYGCVAPFWTIGRMVIDLF